LEQLYIQVAVLVPQVVGVVDVDPLVVPELEFELAHAVRHLRGGTWRQF
jgi:hypothetical protein